MSDIIITPREGYLETSIDGVSGYADSITFPPVSTTWNPNLEPMFSVGFDDTTYWAQAPGAPWTQLTGGWAHADRDNSSASGQYNNYFRPFPDQAIAEGDTFTLLIEARNITKTGNPAIVVQQSAVAQLNPTAGETQLIRFTEGMQVYVPMTAGAIGSTTDRLFSTGLRLYAGNVIDADVRMSLYRGSYAGPYMPVL